MKTWIKRNGDYALTAGGIEVATLTGTTRGWVGRWHGGDYIGNWGRVATAKKEIAAEFDRLSLLYT